MLAEQDVDRLLSEHGALLRAHAEVQARCTALLREQAERIRALDATLMRARAQAVLSLTRLAWEREERAALERAAPGLTRRAAMGRQVEALQARLHVLKRELARHQHRREPAEHAAPAAQALPPALETSLRAADLVICQTGCLSHGDYWRVHDHCRRSGKLCMLVDQPDRVHIVRIDSLTHSLTTQR